MEGPSKKARKAQVKPRARNLPAKVKAKAKVKEPEVYDPRPRHGHFWFTDTGFNILPKHIFHPAIASHLTQVPVNMNNRVLYLEENFPLRDPAPHLPTKKDIDWFKWSKLKSSVLRKAVVQIMKARWLFRKLLHHYRTKKLTVANTEDIFTTEVPKRPVFIVDWVSKQRYVFEAHTLMRDLTCRLMHNDGLFEYPQQPRNPFTNQPLTQSQIISVWNSISSAGIYTSSAFALFRKARYSLGRYLVENSSYLKINALSKVMKDPTCYDFRDRLIDFITFAYDQESLDCKINAYHYAISNYPTHPLLKRWADACYKFHEATILYAASPLVLNEKKDDILDYTLDLINCENQLTRLYTALVDTDVHDTVESFVDVLIIGLVE
jgi:hypothetical protein